MTPAEIRARKRKAWEMFRTGSTDQEVADAVGVKLCTARDYRHAIGLPATKQQRIEPNIPDQNASLPTPEQIAIAAAEIRNRNMADKRDDRLGRRDVDAYEHDYRKRPAIREYQHTSHAITGRHSWKCQ